MTKESGEGQDDRQKAWDKYLAYTKLGGSDTWVNMLKKADLASPFDGTTLKDIAEKAHDYLSAFDLSDIR